MADLKYPFPDIPAAGEVTPVAEGVFWLRMPMPLGIDHINLWLLADGEGWTIVDTGIRSRRVQEIWEGLFSGFMGDRVVKRLICTHHHPDHFGLAGWICARRDTMLWMARAEYFSGRAMVLDSQERPPAEVMAYYKRAGVDEAGLKGIEEAGYNRLQEIVVRPPSAYRRLRDGEELTIGGRLWRIVSGRGHSPEHICLLNEALGVLISGDQVLPGISSNISVGPTEPFANPLADWMESLRRFKELSNTLLVLPAHGLPFQGLHARLDQLIEGHNTRLETIVALCDSPVTAVEIMPQVYRRKLEGFDFLLGLGECLAHLHYLVDEGWLGSQEDDLGVRRFRRV
jgi:glyoxylase-like metal-dependent hydrolase (beta-lactamase superfamily II)